MWYRRYVLTPGTGENTGGECPSALLARRTRTVKGRGWGLIIFCARTTRILRRLSHGLMARLGVPVGGRERKLRAVEDQSAPITERERASLEGRLCLT